MRMPLLSMRIVLVAAALLAGVDGSFAQTMTSQSTGSETATSRDTTPARLADGGIELRVSRFLDLHYLVRSHAAEGERPAEPSLTGLEEATRAVQSIDREVGGTPGWGLLEALFASADTLADVERLVPAMPERFQARNGREIPVQSLGRRLVEAYRPLAAEFDQRCWPARFEALEKKRAALTAGLLPRAADARKDICDALLITDPGVRIPVTLVTDSPEPGGFTFRSRAGCACVVRVGGIDGSLLDEVVLHEAIHALDVASGQQETVLQRLRLGLARAGCAPQSALYRDIPHTLIFVQAAETVRRKHAAGHRHYGDVHGYYAKVGRVSACVREAWTARLEGRQNVEQTLQQLVECASTGSDANSP